MTRVADPQARRGLATSPDASGLFEHVRPAYHD